MPVGSKWLLLVPLSCALVFGGIRSVLAQTQEPKKDIPTIAHDAAKAIVLVVVSDSSGKEIKQGSGIVVSRDGKVLTNYHVIAAGSSAVIKFQSGAFYLVDGVLAADKSRDIAVLKAAGIDFPAVPLGDSSTVQVGDEVVTIGSPLALEATVSNGIISSVRSIDGEQILQTTAPISPGSSGGALLNMHGEVVGITTAQMVAGQNLNFAIPINYAKKLLESAQAMKKISGLDDLASQQEPESVQPGGIPQMWTSLSTGHDLKIRIEGGHVYVEVVFPPAYAQIVQQGAFTRCDLKQDHQSWTGSCVSYLPHQWIDGWYREAHVTWCSSQGKEEISLLTPTRIEGEAETFDAKDFDAKKCLIRKTTMMHFVWIPKD